MTRRRNKQRSQKRVQAQIFDNGLWRIVCGKLVPPAGRPEMIKSLFNVVAEKLPFDCLDVIKRDMQKQRLPSEGIYLAHDSMGAVRYVGRGKLFDRLRARRRAHPLELLYFSLYVVSNKKHEREIETLVIRATSHLLEFNEKKKRSTIEPGSIRDYEAGTCFYQRRKRRSTVSAAKTGV